MSIKNDLIRIAHYYYNLDYSQQEIADKLGISRKTVNVYLKRAREEAIVEIKVHGYRDSDMELEQKLEQKLHLKEVLVTEQGGNDAFAKTVIQYLDKKLKDGMNVGVSYGSTLAGVFSGPHGEIKKDINIIQLVGGVNIHNIAFKSEEVTRKFANVFGAKMYSLYMPNIVENRDLKTLLMEEKAFAPLFALYEKLDMAVVAVGTIQKRDILLTEGYISEKEHEKIEKKSAVCDYCFRFLNEDGEIVDEELEERVTGISTENLKKIPLRLCVSYGEHKVIPILSALRGGYINGLITDRDTAKKLLEKTQGN